MGEFNIRLCYPSDWVREPNPSAQAAEGRTLNWLREHGIVHDARSERAFAEMNVAEYAGRPFPLADAETLELLMKTLTLWLLYDDVIEGRSETDPELLLDCVCGIKQATGQESAVHQAWLELGIECRTRMSPAWVERHRQRFATWLRSVQNEARMVNAYRASGSAPSLLDYLSVRMVTIGVVPTLDFLEIDLGAELPPSFLSSNIYRDLEVAATLLVILQNDITGFTKDRLNHWLNGALSAAGPEGDPLDGLHALVRLHDEYVVLLASRTAELSAHSTHLQQWAERLCLMVGGWSKWHVAARRYSDRLEVSAGHIVHIASDVRELSPAPADRAPDLLPDLKRLCG